MFGGTRVVFNALTARPLHEGVAGDVLLGGVVGATFGAGAPAAIARLASFGTKGAAAAPSGEVGLTDRIASALERVGPQVRERVDAVVRSVPSKLDVLVSTDAETGAVTIRGGVGNGARQIILNTDGTSVVRAFDAAKGIWNTIREIKPQ